MFLIYKGKGILVPVFIVIPVITVAILSGVLKRNLGGIFAMDYSNFIPVGIGFLLSGIWTRFASKDYIKINGVKKEIDLGNSVFNIKLGLFGYILFGFGLVSVGYGIFKTIANS